MKSMLQNRFLMIFVRNPEAGRVKKRLAATLGNEKALAVYKKLLLHTCEIASAVDSDRGVFYSEFIDEHDLFPSTAFTRFIQEGNDLGERMSNAFRLAFDKQYTPVVIIGSDCYELTSDIVEQAFCWLEEKDAVIGPAEDGGYYLLGMNSFIGELFKGKEWSCENVLVDTLLDLQKNGISYELLPTLSDVDREEDLGRLKEML